jgi:3-dehydroquinate synthase
MSESIKIKTSRKSQSYEVTIARGSMGDAGKWARSVVGGVRRICVVSNNKVFGLYGDRLSKSLATAGFNVNVHVIGDSERFKNLKTLERILDNLSKFGISRTDAVIGFGGGVVGDVAGFAASIHLRGVDYLQIPTTLLSMVDSSVGGKTGVNTAFGKNLAGTFYQPKGVLIDREMLFTLPKREITAGYCECVKQAAVSGKSLLDLTMSSLDSVNLLQRNELADSFEAFLATQIAFKAKIVAGDARESAHKNDAKSRKILNFGHTLAHALEKSSNYRLLKHGEAVGYGVIFASEISKKLGLLDAKVVNLLSDVVHRAGKLPSISKLDPDLVFEAIRHDKKNIDNSVRWVLLKDIGKPLIVPHKEIGDKLVRSTIKEFISSN